MKTLLRLLFCLYSFNILAQSPVPLIPQTNDLACGGASLAMFAQAVAPTNLTFNQCYFLTQFQGDVCCSVCDNSTVCSAAVPLTQKIAFKLAGQVVKVCSTQASMGLRQIAALVNNTATKPIIFDYRYGSTSTNSHICVMVGVEKQVFDDNSNLAFIKINDPWPACVGNKYYISYERYNILKASTASSRAAGLPTGKYTIFSPTSPTITCTNVSLNAADNTYLSHILFHANKDSLIATFLRNIRQNHASFTDDFFDETHLPKQNLDLVNRGTSLPISNTTVALSAQMTWNGNLNLEKNEALFPLKVGEKIVTVLSVSKTSPQKWTIYHIEKGETLEEFQRTTAVVISKQIASPSISINRQSSRFSAKNTKEPVILRFTDIDTYFILFTKEGENYVYDLYGDGFRKLNLRPENKVITFDEFQKQLKELSRKAYSKKKIFKN